jgi:hypothetical protein
VAEPLTRTVGYPRLTLPEGVREPWRAGDAWYCTDAAREFHQSRSNLRALFGGLGASKTVTLTAQSIYSGFANPGHVGILFEPTIPLVRDVLQPSLEQRLEDFGLRRGRDWTFRQTSWEWHVLGGARRGGFTILGRSMTEWQRIIGVNAAWVGVDEPAAVEEEAIREAFLRVRVGPNQLRFMTGTLNPGTWVVKWARSPPDGAHIVRASTEGNPWISQQYLDQLAASFDTRTLEAMMHGRIVSVTGSAYHSWDPRESPEGNRHRWQYDPGRGLYLTADNNRSPMCGVLVQADGSRKHAFAEVMLEQGSWIGFGEAVAKRLAGKPPAWVVLSGDAVLRGGITDEVTSWGHFADIARGLRRVLGDGLRVEMKCPAANPLEDDRVRGLNALLCNGQGERRLLVDPSCVELIADLEEMQTDDSGRLRKPGRPGGRGVDARRSHLSDSLGYLTNALWNPLQPVRAAARPAIATGTLSLR